MLVGNIAAAAFVDRVGRKTTLLWALSLVAVSSLLSAILPFSMAALIALRFVCGLGMGSMPVPATLLLVEVTPATARASWTFWSSLVGQAGLFASAVRSEEHTSELQSLMRISYAVFCLKKNKENRQIMIDTIMTLLMIKPTTH